ncbi:permease protein HisQ [Salmonella enterica subsp. enterica serovar Rubislaw str. A4-653]|uniref:Histidine/lysine/arginine/ornithine transport system permease protein HisQ n=1 Tax=Salmonella enterica subsp. enterica serovar Rubislaw str. A4-653 TaxID=913081 RepID=G5QM10_SALRU|nr:permease protein HisQ [Salmonella enterica subsp. enterica serovar Rubislaw str. A4-653]
MRQKCKRGFLLHHTQQDRLHVVRVFRRNFTGRDRHAGTGALALSSVVLAVELALSSVVLAVLIGLVGAGAKLSQNRVTGLIFEGYTTLIRGVPDLVLMLLIFYGLQIALNVVTDSLGIDQIDIDPMVAGIITLGFIYGAYFTETFRGAFMAVPKGHIEAATAFGFTHGQTFRRIMFPAMMRYALPGIGNNWQVILKATALVSLLGLEDVVKATQLAGKSTWEPFYFAVVCGLIYLVFTTVSNGVLLLLERRYSVGVKRADL